MWTRAYHQENIRFIINVLFVKLTVMINEVYAAPLEWVVQLLTCVWLCNPMNCSTTDSSVLTISQSLLKFIPLSRWCYLTISSHAIPFSFSQSFPASGSSLMNWLFTSGGQNIVASTSASVLPMNIQGWCPLWLTGLISFLSKEWGTSF